MSDRLPGLYLPKCTPGKAAECRTSLISFFFLLLFYLKIYLISVKLKKKEEENKTSNNFYTRKTYIEIKSGTLLMGQIWDFLISMFTTF